MSAIVAAAQRLEDRRIDAVLGRAFVTGDRLRTMQVAAGDVLVDASNAAGAGRVVEGAPRTWAVRWWQVMSDVWVCTNDATDFWIAYADAPSVDLRPCWDAADRLAAALRAL